MGKTWASRENVIYIQSEYQVGKKTGVLHSVLVQQQIAAHSTGHFDLGATGTKKN